MPQAQRMRLREALQEFVSAFTGDTGTRRQGGLHSQMAQADRELVEAAAGLLTAIDGGGQSTIAENRNTPGSRARDRVSPEGAPPPRAGSQGPIDSATTRLRAALGADPTTAPAAEPAGGEGGSAQ